MPDNKKMVEIRRFKMSFGDKTVIKDLSFDVFRGEVFGFLGSNGSGKLRRCAHCLDYISRLRAIY